MNQSTSNVSIVSLRLKRNTALAYVVVDDGRKHAQAILRTCRVTVQYIGHTTL
jgi:hypothetical protein